MLQNPCKTLGFRKNMVYKIPPGGGEVNHIQPVAYYDKSVHTEEETYFYDFIIVKVSKGAKIRARNYNASLELRKT